MKISKKSFIAVAIIFSVLAGIAASPVQTYAKGNYWLYGISEKAGGNMGMYFNGDKITLDGKIRKASSGKGVYNAKEKKGTYKLKIADKCKVILDEAGNVQTLPFRKWVRECGYKSGDEITFISAVLTVRGKKITNITFSA